MDNQKSKLDKFFSNPVAAVAMAILCNILWGSALPFIKMGYRMFAIDSSDTATILCFAGVRFMMGAALVWLAGLALNRRPLPMPRGKQLAVCCGLGLWQTAAQYFFYYSAAALLTGAMGGIINSTQSFMGVIVAHFLYGNVDRMTPRKALGCVLGFGGVLFATLGNYGSGSAKGILYMLLASAIFSLAGPWNKAAAKKTDSFTVSVLNLRRVRAGRHRLCHGWQLAPAAGRGYPGIARAGVHFRRWLCAVGFADEEQPHFPHRHLRAYYPNHERAALGPAQRRAAV